jgi:hypothetical protein
VQTKKLGTNVTEPSSPVKYYWDSLIISSIPSITDPRITRSIDKSVGAVTGLIVGKLINRIPENEESDIFRESYLGRAR